MSEGPVNKSPIRVDEENMRIATIGEVKQIVEEALGPLAIKADKVRAEEANRIIGILRGQKLSTPPSSVYGRGWNDGLDAAIDLIIYLGEK